MLMLTMTMYTNINVHEDFILEQVMHRMSLLNAFATVNVLVLLL